ncbi:MAG: GFA family protein [Candidatus Rokuibacteriota bacterium]
MTARSTAVFSLTKVWSARDHDQKSKFLRFSVIANTPLPVNLEGTDFVALHAGALDDEASTRPFRHIFVGQNASWHTITDDLPQFAEHAPRDQRLPRREGA